MLSDRATALELILAHEGGKVDHPEDPGGRTNRGITQRTYDGWRTANGLPKRDVWKIDNAEVHAIYNQQYLSVVWYDRLPAGLNYAVADYAVNSGPGQAVKDLQRTLKAMLPERKISFDGVMGNMTLAAALELDAKIRTSELIRKYIERRMAFLRGRKKWPTFGRGWTRRVIGDKVGAQPGQDNGVLDYALAMSLGNEALRKPLAIGVFTGEEVAAKALPEDIAATGTIEGKATIATGVTGALVVLNEVMQELTPLSDAPYLGDTIKVVLAAMGLGSAALLLYSAVQNLAAKRAGAL